MKSLHSAKDVLDETSSLTCDVIVAGGGPVGSHAGFRMAQKGFATAILEQRTDPGEAVCCTGIISEECLAAYAIDPALVFRHCNSATIYSPSGKSIQPAADRSLAVVVDRPALNVFMAKRARDAGAAYIGGFRVTGVSVNKDGVTVSGLLAGSTKRLNARALIVATGWNSGLTRTLGLGKPGNIVVGAQAHVETEVSEVQVFTGKDIAPQFFGWVVPTSPHRGLAGLLTRSQPGPGLKRFLQFLKEDGRIASAAVPVTAAPLPLSPLRRTYADGVVVVGTAAGLVKPTTGGGIYFGLLSADIATDVLEDAMKKNDLSAHNLAEYQDRWKSRLGREIRAGAWGRRMFERLSDSRMEQGFDIMRRTDVLESLLSSEDLSFDWHGRIISNLLRARTLATILRGMSTHSKKR
jgi:digeranylgeranylglycerophospholipid reductase